METDIGDTLAPNGDSIASAEFLGGPRIVTITAARVIKGAERPVEITLAEFDRPYKPNVTMRRLLVAAWGPRSADYIGRRLELYRDEGVRFGKEPAPGIRISRMSDITEPVSPRLPTGRNKSETITAQPLPDAPVDPAVVDAAHAAINQATTTQKLDEIAAHATRIGIHHQVKTAIEKRRVELEK